MLVPSPRATPRDEGPRVNGDTGPSSCPGAAGAGAGRQGAARTRWGASPDPARAELDPRRASGTRRGGREPHLRHLAWT